MPKYQVTMYMNATDVLRSSVEVEADSEEAARIAAKGLYFQEPWDFDFHACGETELQDANQFEVEMPHYAESIPGSASFDDGLKCKTETLRVYGASNITEVTKSNSRRNHPQDAPEQCFDAARWGSPYFTITVRADIGDGRGREASIVQGFQDGKQVHRPMSTLEPTEAQALGNADVLAELLRSFHYLLVKYEGQFGPLAIARREVDPHVAELERQVNALASGDPRYTPVETERAQAKEILATLVDRWPHSCSGVGVGDYTVEVKRNA